MIKVLESFFALSCVFCLAGSAYGGFLIELHSGAEIIVNNYWEEEGEIRYFRHGGIIGVPAAEVSEVHPTDEKPVASSSRSSRADGLSPAKTRPALAESLSETHVKDSKNPEAKEGGLRPESEEFRQRSDELRHQLTLIYSDAKNEARNVENARRNKDEEAEKEAMSRLEGLLKKQNKLSTEIEQLYGGSLPPWWFEIIERP